MYQNDQQSSAAASEQPTNLFQAITKSNGPLLGAALTIPSVFVAQIIGQTNCDFVFLDMEHSPMSPEMMTSLVHAITASSRSRVLTLVRVPSQGVEWIKWALDSGAAGVIIPMVNNRKEAEDIVSKGVFPPRGKRSFGPARAPWGLPDGAQGGVATYFQRALKSEVAILPMIESAEGLENVEDILSVDGISGAFIGPMDLRLALGLPGIDGAEAAYADALGRIVRAAKGNGKILGSLGLATETLQKFEQLGMEFLVAAVDTAALTGGITSSVSAAAKALESRSKSSL